MLLAIMHFIPGEDDPRGIVAKLMEPLAPGSYLVMSHASSDIEAGGLDTAADRYNSDSVVRIHMRSAEQVTGLYDGLEIIGPGVVPLGTWRPGPLGAGPQSGLPTYTAVARKP
jgi:hypothetical protein